jgi:hypothetical protein
LNAVFGKKFKKKLKKLWNNAIKREPKLNEKVEQYIKNEFNLIENILITQSFQHLISDLK